ncbi:hypothetical protein LOTGIDRAFT_232784 [Lottia gigantea]|uniref:Coiled-coil domain-containing protein 137 n=1 Tax=Lottia gigantea TaxID=225164 RepID=V3ZPT2_LOTGI|nr:hypothetical protein LOTGIDRAFT_232784 [Lottia gigantea]ESO93383.1 hypothetical protein LOTGIDRAFT_232784 [Lottia gigantea]
MSKISNTQRRKKNKKFEHFRKKLRETQLNAKKAPRIGKPQKSKKHKKLKAVDPFYHGERKDKLFKGINQKPQSLEQEVPKKALEVLELMKETKKMKKKKKKAKHQVSMKPEEFRKTVNNSNNDNNLGISNALKQQPGETDRRFLHRLNEESKKAMLMAKLADKWDADVVETEDGEFKIKKEKKPSEKKKRRAAEKREEKRQKRDEKFIDDYQEFKTFEDHVEFGEVVHAPPSLSSLPRKANKDNGARKPGSKSLILKDILISNKLSNNNSERTTGKRKVGQSLKRKLISPAQQVILDKERDRVIDVYRQMKEAKLKK